MITKKSEIEIKTSKKEELVDITEKVRSFVKETGIKSGLLTVFSHHTTGAITVNDGSDGDVARDILLGLSKAFPEDKSFMHMEGNSTAHIKSSTIGCSVPIIITNGYPDLGLWQSVLFCEFDGPRTRKILLFAMGD